MTRTGRTSILAGLAALTLCLGASAQEAPLPSEIISAPSLTSPQRDRIADFVQNHAAQLTGDTRAEVERARDALLDPLTQTNMSVAFRLEYATQVVPHLERVAGSSSNANEHSIVNCLQVAGAVASDRSVAILNANRSHDSLSVRFAAVVCFQRVFDAMRRGANPANPGRIVDNLIEGMQTEADILVVGAYARSLISAARVNRDDLVAMRNRALTAATDGTGKRMREADDGADHGSLLRVSLWVGSEVRDILRDDQSLSPSVRGACAGLGGDMLAYIDRSIRSGRLANGSAAHVGSQMRTMATIAENVIILSFAPAVEASRNVGNHIETGNYTEFSKASREWFSRLNSAYGLKLDRFIN